MNWYTTYFYIFLSLTHIFTGTCKYLSSLFNRSTDRGLSMYVDKVKYLLLDS